MKQTLLLKLSNQKNFNSEIPLINQFAYENQDLKITLLTFEHNAKYFHCISDQVAIETIDMAAIRFLNSSQLIDTNHAFRLFSKQIANITNKRWDRLIDLELNSISVNLASAIDADEKNGTTLNSQNVCEYSTYANFLENEICTQRVENKLINPTLLHSLALDLNLKQSYYANIDTEDARVIKTNFSKMREKFGNDKMFIGICVNDVKPKEILSLAKFIDSTLNSFNLHPVLIYTNNDESVQNIIKLNQVFNNKLLSIKASHDNLPIIFSNCDINIVFSTEILNFSLVSRRPIFYFSEKLEVNNLGINYNFLRSDIATVLDLLLNIFEADAPDKIETYFKAHNYLKNEFKNSYINFSNPFDYISEIFTLDSKLNQNINLGATTISNLLTHDKKNNLNLELVSLTKLILSSLKILKDDIFKIEPLIANIERIYHFATKGHISQNSVISFKSQIERMTSTDPSENKRQIEKFLFQLKDEIKEINSFLEENLNPKNINKDIRATL